MKLTLEIDPEQIDAEFLTRIGHDLENGGTFKQDALMAVRAYDAAASCPDGALAANNLGWMFLKGIGIEQNTEKALTLFRNAAERGNSLAMVNLGNFYEFATPPNYRSAAHWYRVAAESGDYKGMFNYANMLHHGRGVRQNRKRAYSIFSTLYEIGVQGAAFYNGTLSSGWVCRGARLSEGPRVLPNRRVGRRQVLLLSTGRDVCERPRCSERLPCGI